MMWSPYAFKIYSQQENKQCGIVSVTDSYQFIKSEYIFHIPADHSTV